MGTTTIEEAVGILSNMAGVKIDGPYKDESYNQRTVYWEFPNYQSGGKAWTGGNGSLIITMDLALDYGQKLDLREVIEKYGFPDYILVRECRGEFIRRLCIVNLIYDEGLALELFIEEKHGKVDISPDSEILDIQFFQPGIKSYIRDMSESELDISKSIMKWDGYMKYEHP